MGVTVIPAIDQQFSAQFSSDAAGAAQKIRAQYGDTVSAACYAFGMDASTVIGFMIVENTGVDPSAESGAGAIGLMQLEPVTAFQTIKNQAPAIPASYQIIVAQALPGFLKPLGLVGFYASWQDRIAAALLDPTFNIWTGVAQLAQLANRSQKRDGTVRIDHVVVMYNAGVGNYYKYVVDTGLEDVDVDALIAQLGIPESVNYIVKLMGSDGAIMAALRTA